MKKIIIIGATSGIGREMAKIYAARNYMVGITGRRKELLDSLQEEFPENMITACFDVTADKNIAELENLIQQLGGLDILIYNSGFGDPSEKLDWEIDKRTTQTNVNGFIEMVNFAFNNFAEKSKGHIVGVSSIAAIRGNSWAPAYSASKAYMSTYLEGLHMKAARMKLDIAVTDIQPGFIKTKMAKGNKQFWVSSVIKAVTQIIRAIDKKKRKAYISKRWWLIAKIIKWLPYWLYKKVG